MKYLTLATVLFGALATAASKTTTSASSSISPGAVVSDVAPAQSPPPGCSPDYDGQFEIGPVNYTKSKRDLSARDNKLGISLSGGVLMDYYNRTGYVASNYQFQFDDPPQAGAIYTGGFSICANGSLALGNDLVWYKCLSGTFYNLYWKSIGGQCIKSYIVAYGLNGGSPAPVPSSLSTEIFSTSASTAKSNGTMSASASASSSGATGVGHHHATKTSSKTGSKASSKTTKKSSKTGAAATSSASSSTSSAGAVQTNTVGGAMLGLAGGLFALALI